MDLDLSNLTINSTFHAEDTFTFALTAMEVLNACTAICSAFANAIILYIIAKFSVMKSRTNMYIANWCICNFFEMISAPASLNLFGFIYVVPYEIMCLWEETLYGVLFGNLVFVAMVLLDWYIMTYSRQSCALRCRQSAKFLIAITWILIFIFSSLSVSLCIQNLSFPLTLMLYIIGYLFIFITFIIIFILRLVKIKTSSVVVEKSNLELILVTSYFLCWLLNWGSLYGQIFLGWYFHYHFEYFTFFVGYSNAWILLLLLYFYDEKFKSCFRKTFNVSLGGSEDDKNIKETQNTMLL